ncbi:MAG: rod shape-determining protein MreD [Sphingopyxis sp.]
MARLLPSDEKSVVLPIKLRLIPIGSVLIATLIAALPLNASAPIWPPLGFMMLISWRMLRGDLWPVWIGIPLGLFDDLVSGQPVGSAVALWTLAMLAMDVIDRRIIWRDFWLDWLLAALGLLILLLASAVFARAGNMAHIIALIGPQFLWSAMLLPLTMRAAAALDDWRRRS